jgi:16S rRNA C967 or C1407 C5-methylase (RsmB/RsmF family)
MSPGTCCVLVREIVMGSGVSRIGKAEKIVLEMEGQLKRVLEKMMSDAGVTDVSELLPKNEMEEAANKRRRTLRVNTLKCSVEMAIEALQKTVRIMNLAL